MRSNPKPRVLAGTLAERPANPDIGTFYFVTDAAVDQLFIFANVAGVSSWLPVAIGALESTAYGDGSDGAVVFDGIATPVAGATLVGTTYTLTRDIFATTVVVAGVGLTIDTAGWRIFAQESIQGTDATSVISNEGSPGASGALGGAGGNGALSRNSAGGGLVSTLVGGGDGGAGGVAAVGTAGVALVVTKAPENAVGGAGGAGGTSGVNAGGAGVTPTTFTGLFLHRFVDWMAGFSQSAIPIALSNGVMIGGGGGGGGGGSGGGGGGGAGIVFLAAPTISFAGTVRADGGNGGDGNAGGGAAGGGAGGGGGLIITIGRSVTVAPVSAAGGIGGAGAGGGVAGANGTAPPFLQPVIVPGP